MGRGITAGIIAAGWTAVILLDIAAVGVVIWAVIKLVNHFAG